MSQAESAINMALERAYPADDTDDNEVVTIEVEELDDPFVELDENAPLLDGLRKLITAEDSDEMTKCRQGWTCVVALQEQRVCHVWQKAQVTQGGLDDERGSAGHS